MFFLLDANIYIEAHGSYYDMDICPGFWDFLDKTHLENKLSSIKQIQKELKRPKPAKAKENQKQQEEDKLSVWAKNRNHHFLDDEDEATQLNFATIVEYVLSLQNINEANRQNFLDGADPWIIAKAMTLKSSGVEVKVATHERLVAPNSTKIKVPNVCQYFGIDYVDSFSLLRTLEAKFTLK